MARVKFGAIVVDMSGKLGGHVFAKNKSGSYVRTKTTPLNPRTALQTDVRAMFATLSSGWGNLTDVQRQSFIDGVVAFGKTDVFGDIKNPTGKALYQRLNQNLSNTSQALVSVAPQPAEIPFVNASAASGAAAVPAFSIANAGDTTGSKLIIYATPKLSQGTQFVKNKLRQLQVTAGGNGVAIDILAAYTAKFGALVAGDNIFVGIRTVNSIGMASPMQVLKAVIAA